MPGSTPHGFGWYRDPPDLRDLTLADRAIRRWLKPLRPRRTRPERVDWREFFGPVQQQGELPTSPAHACAALLAYFERRATGHVFEPSRRFLDQASRRLQAACGGGGVTLRTIWKAVAHLGTPPEELLPYDMARRDVEPDAFVYAAAHKFPSLRYIRLDPRGSGGPPALDNLLAFLAAGLPCVLGFLVGSRVSQDAEIPLPTIYDRVRGGQAVVAVGYDAGRRLPEGKGALLVRNCWGTEWGDHGYGWLPYAYVRDELAVDLWTVLTPQWLASGEFRRP